MQDTSNAAPIAPTRHRALATALDYLRCPVCRGRFRWGDRRLVCHREHSFDLARQGYVNLVVRHQHRASADPPEAVAARARFLSAGHYHRIATAIQQIVSAAAPDTDGAVVDLAGGTGYYLAQLLDALPGRVGICLDLSTPALRRAARAHPRAAAIGADVWQPLPLADRCAGVVLSVFGPRHPAEIRRILQPGGLLVVATPTTAHLRELLEPIGMLRVEQDKPRRLDNELTGLDRLTTSAVDYAITLDHSAITDLVTMGPSGRHLSPEILAGRVRRVSQPVSVTVSVRVNVYRSRQSRRDHEDLPVRTPPSTSAPPSP